MIYIQILLTILVISIFGIEIGDTIRTEQYRLPENRMGGLEVFFTLVLGITFFTMAMLFIWIGLPTFKH